MTFVRKSLRRVPEFAVVTFLMEAVAKNPSITLGKRFASPLQSNHQRKAAAVCFVYGSARTAPGISSRLREISVLLALIAT